ncbi:hypothetical protein F4604DRAFT_1525013, partial [Suillus subluteus]
ATRVGATACACLGYFVPHCVVDFQNSEWQVSLHLLHMNIDYSICNAIKHAANRIDNSLVIYDVGYQWNLHFAEHVNNCSSLTLPDNSDVTAQLTMFVKNGHCEL